MRKHLVSVAIVTVALLLAAMLVAWAGLAQGPDTEPSGTVRSSDPVGSKVVYAGSQAGPEDVGPEVAAPNQSYNATVRISGSALKPRESYVEWSGVSGAGGCIYATSGNPLAVLSTPVYLPEGSTIRYFRMYYNDQNVDTDASAWLTAYDLYGMVDVEWGVSTSGTGKTYVTTEQLDHEIDYSLHSYMINWRPYELGSDMQVCGFRIYYAAPPGAVYLPSIMSND